MRSRNKSANSQGRQPKYRKQSAHETVAKKRKEQSPRKNSQAYRQDKANTNKWLRNLPLIMACLVILGSVGYIAQLDAQSAQVRVVARQDSSIDDELLQVLRRDDSYLESFESELSGSWLNRSKLTVRSADVIANILNAYPEIANAEIRYGVVDDTPILHMVLREPHIIIVEVDRTLLLDRHGRAFAQVADATVSPDDLATIEDIIAPLEVDLGEQLLPIETVEFIDQLRHQFRSKDLSVRSKTLPAIANELHVRVQGDDYVGKFDITGDVRLQAGAFIATREQLIDDAITPKEYIDARVTGRVYYR